MEDLQQLLAEAFAAELAEHLAVIRAGLALASVGGAPDLRDIFRRAHSLKGAARAIDREDIESTAHALESLLADVEQGRKALDGAAIDETRGLADAIEDLAAAAPVEEGAPPAEDAVETVRVSSRPLERLACTVRILQGDLETRALIASDLRDTRAEIESLRTACLAANAKLPDIAARLTRLLASTGALASRRIAADWQVERTAAQLAGEAERILLVPVASLIEGLERMVRSLAAEEGKDAELIVRCEAIEADRRVLQGVRDALTHLVRNAISHGVELPDARRRAGKPDRATVTVELREEAGQLLIAVEDDGAGPDVAAIVRAARARGVDGGADLSEDAALSLVFEHGVSTSIQVDRLSGRGVGLAVVADAARRLHGGVRMVRGARGGTRVELGVPLAITRRPMLLVEVAGQTFAIPTRGAYRAVRFDASRIEMQGGAPMLAATADTGDRSLPIVSLAGLLGSVAAPIGERIEAFALRIGDDAALIVVDALLDVRTLLIGDAEAIAVDTPLILGSVLIEEGRLALVLSPEGLAERILRGGRGIAPPAAGGSDRRQQTILVVDDSITTRTLERGILEGHGYRVLVSVDGVAGIEALRAAAGTIDLVVADVEMPRMDGFGLLAAIRNDPSLADIPVVMMTSRNSPDDIQRGLDLGANAYVTKQEFDQGALLATVGRLI